MRKLFTIETSDVKEWDDVLKSVQESINSSSFIGFEISVACRIYNSNAFREWLDTLSEKCDAGYYRFLHRVEIDLSGRSAVKKIIFHRVYDAEDIEIAKEQRNCYARRVEELEEALKEYQYDIVPTLKEECKNQAKELTYLNKKIEKLKDAANDSITAEEYEKIVSHNSKFIEKLQKYNTELLERNKRLMNDNVLLKTMYEEALNEKQKTGRYPWGVPKVSKSFNDYRTNAVVDQVNDVIHIINKTFNEVNKKFNETDSKLNDIAEHLKELDKFKDSIKKEGDGKYD